MKHKKDEQMNGRLKEFKECLDMHNANLATFIKLYNIWSQLSPDERGDLIEEGIQTNQIYLD